MSDEARSKEALRPEGWTRKYDCDSYETAEGKMRELCGAQNNG